MGQIAIQAESLGKQYRIGARQAKYKTLRETITDTVSAPLRGIQRVLHARRETRNGVADSIWAVRNVSFQLNEGEVLGIVGRNGSGKSTLLKLLSRITEPTEGEAELRGRVGSLLEVGTGFHPELTGRENIFLNGGILGMRRSEIVRKFDEIVAFAGVEKFIDTPVKHYSSGMYLRLAFAVAAHLDPEILLVDEVLAVGDAAFQKKCIGKMGEVAKQGRTILFVSHNMGAITSLCTTALLLEKGEATATGEPGEIVDRYLSTAGADTSTDLASRSDRRGTGRMRMTSFEVLVDGMRTSDIVQSGDAVQFVIGYEADSVERLRNVCFDLQITDMFGQMVGICGSYFTNEDFERLPNIGSVTCTIPCLPLAPDNYRVNLAVFLNAEQADAVVDAAGFTVVHGDFYRTGKLPKRHINGALLFQYKWAMAGAPPASTQQRS